VIMSNIVTGRQLRAARILAGLTQKQLAQAVGVHERAARYWELKENKAPASTRSSLEKIEAVLRGDRICNTDRWCAACHRRCRSEGNSRPELTGLSHEKVICLQAAMSNLPSDFDYSATMMER
jgi:transcriptional regulator with XRE-family HTH domain